MHLKMGSSAFSAGFQSVLATQNNQAVAKYIDPNVEVTPSKSISLSPGTDTEAA